jgi:hypothetical protein
MYNSLVDPRDRKFVLHEMLNIRCSHTFDWPIPDSAYRPCRLCTGEFLTALALRFKTDYL